MAEIWAAIQAAKWLLPAVTGAIVGLCLGLAVGYGWGYWSGIDVGKGEARAEIQRQDDKAIGAADEGRGTVARCRAIGGVWNQSTGKCGGG